MGHPSLSVHTYLSILLTATAGCRVGNVNRARSCVRCRVLNSICPALSRALTLAMRAIDNLVASATGRKMFYHIDVCTYIVGLVLCYRAKPCNINFELESDYARTNLVGRRATWRSGLLVADPPHSGGVEGSLNVIEKNIHTHTVS